jgi:hypothetical protein
VAMGIVKPGARMETAQEEPVVLADFRARKGGVR